MLDLPFSSADSAVPVVLDTISSALSRLWRFTDEYVLGTRLEILVNGQDALLAQEAATAARKEINRLDSVFNVRRDDSEISLLNSVGSMAVTPDLYAVAQLSEQWRLITRGTFDGRMGRLLRLWSTVAAPTAKAVELELASLRATKVKLDASSRTIRTSAELSLDAIAKGYIVDAALNAARRAAPGIQGLAVNIGGDIRCWGDAPDCTAWRIGIPDPINPADNAPLVDFIALKNAAIATSGRGPRDSVDDGYRSTTVSPLTGCPIRDVISATVVASHTADADAMATACLVQSPRESLALADTLGLAVRITDARNRIYESSAWPALRIAAATAPKPEANRSKGNNSRPPGLAPERRWPADWEIGILYVAPERNERERAADFRTPYMVLWITDERNRPVNTPVIVGTDPSWHHDNYIWWGSHGARAEPLIHLRSQATALSGRYRIFWSGWDDNMQPLPIGKYTLHLETSQERGKHEYRSIVLDIGRERFKKSLPSLPGSGGLEITYGHYNDRFKDE